MQREEKQMDMFLENSLVKLSDLKKAIAQMIQKIGKFQIENQICLHFILWQSSKLTRNLIVHSEGRIRMSELPNVRTFGANVLVDVLSLKYFFR